MGPAKPLVILCRVERRRGRMPRAGASTPRAVAALPGPTNSPFLSLRRVACAVLVTVACFLVTAGGGHQSARAAADLDPARPPAAERFGAFANQQR